MYSKFIKIKNIYLLILSILYLSISAFGYQIQLTYSELYSKDLNPVMGSGVLINHSTVISPSAVKENTLVLSNQRHELSGHSSHLSNTPFYINHLAKPAFKNNLPVNRLRAADPSRFEKKSLIIPLYNRTTNQLDYYTTTINKITGDTTRVEYPKLSEFYNEASKTVVFAELRGKTFFAGILAPDTKSKTQNNIGTIHWVSKKVNSWIDLQIANHLLKPTSQKPKDKPQPKIIKSVRANPYGIYKNGFVIHPDWLLSLTKTKGAQQKLLPMSPIFLTKQLQAQFKVQPVKRIRKPKFWMNAKSIYFVDPNTLVEQELSLPSNPEHIEQLAQNRPEGTGVYIKLKDNYILVGIIKGVPKSSIKFIAPISEVNNTIDFELAKDILSGSGSVKPSKPKEIDDLNIPLRPEVRDIPETIAKQFPKKEEDSQEVDWNVLVYCNDNPDDPSKITNMMDQLVRGLNNKKIRVLLQYKLLLPSNHSPFEIRKPLPLGENMISGFTGTHRFVLQGDTQLIGTSNANQEIFKFNLAAGRNKIRTAQWVDNFIPGQIRLKDAIQVSTNMGSKTGLKNFLNWTRTYPAKKTMLVIWTHGGAWQWVSRDQTSLSIPDFRRAVEESYGSNKELDILRFDSCRTGMFEVAYELRNVCKYLIFSQQVTPLDLAPPSYKFMLRGLSDNTNVSALDFAKNTIDYYRSSFQTYFQTQREVAGFLEDDPNATWKLIDGYTLSLIDTSKIDAFKVHYDRLGTLLIKGNFHRLDPAYLRKNVQSYGDRQLGKVGFDLCVDMHHLVQLIRTLPSQNTNLRVGPTTQICTSILDALKPGNGKMILKNSWQENNVKNSHGVSIYFPARSMFYTNDRTNNVYREFRQLSCLTRDWRTFYLTAQ